MSEFNRMSDNGSAENIWNAIMAESTRRTYANEVLDQAEALKNNNRTQAADLTLFRMITGASHATMVDIVERSLARLNDEIEGKSLSPSQKRGTIAFPRPSNVSTSASSPTSDNGRKRASGEDTSSRTKKPKAGTAGATSTSANKSASEE